ncbi:MAG: hypothetical protein BYD32DRAFT_220626 [Podila humilis]|nr:MAG: hypothetical protein BYD32DRAFT_220626 [Podila humilis]
MQRRRPWRDNYILGSTFNQIAAECNWPFKQFVKVRVKDQESLKSKLGASSLAGLRASMLEQVEFEYLLPWPLAGIVYSKVHTKQMYSRITTLLFQVKIAKLTMEQSAFLKFKGTGNTTLGTLRKLRLRFLSTINDLWSYLMTTVLDSQIKKFHSEVERQGDLDDIILLSQRTINICYERCFLKDRTQPLLRTLTTILNLALKFSAIFTSYIQETEKAKTQSGGTPGSLPSASPMTDIRSHKSRSGRRVSFTVQGVSGSSTQGRRIGDELSSSDSEEEDDGHDMESDERHRQSLFTSSAPKTLLFSQSDIQDMKEDDEDEDGDLDMDSIVFMDRAKKQRTGTDLSVRASFTSSSAEASHYQRGKDDGFDDRLPRSPRKKRPPQFLSKSRSRGRSRSRSRTRGEDEGSTLEQLEAIEREFSRCRDFLAKSLRVVVNSNAARGYNASRRLLEGGVIGAGDVDVGSGEGGSDYLEGLILSLLS